MNNRYIDECVFDTDGKEYEPANDTPETVCARKALERRQGKLIWIAIGLTSSVFGAIMFVKMVADYFFGAA